jgi:hypothetical protein
MYTTTLRGPALDAAASGNCLTMGKTGQSLPGPVLPCCLIGFRPPLGYVEFTPSPSLFAMRQNGHESFDLTEGH